MSNHCKTSWTIQIQLLPQPAFLSRQIESARARAMKCRQRQQTAVHGTHRLK
ncbi:hypothetical protein [Paenibacillus lentus]|uniref:hypothetical protein n=1 Tax=Paenibacillus lentus TaxID=1338368 RepID=UPI0036D231D2